MHTTNGLLAKPPLVQARDQPMHILTTRNFLGMYQHMLPSTKSHSPPHQRPAPTLSNPHILPTHHFLGGCVIRLSLFLRSVFVSLSPSISASVSMSLSESICLVVCVRVCVSVSVPNPHNLSTIFSLLTCQRLVLSYKVLTHP